MRHIKEATIRQGDFNEMLDVVSIYDGHQARVLFTNEYGSGVSLSKTGKFDIYRGSYFIRVRKKPGDFVRIDPIGDITYKEDNGEYFLEIETNTGSLTIDFI